MYYVGVDLHKKIITVCVMNENQRSARGLEDSLFRA